MTSWWSPPSGEGGRGELAWGWRTRKGQAPLLSGGGPCSGEWSPLSSLCSGWWGVQTSCSRQEECVWGPGFSRTQLGEAQQLNSSVWESTHQALEITERLPTAKSETTNSQGTPWGYQELKTLTSWRLSSEQHHSSIKAETKGFKQVPKEHRFSGWGCQGAFCPYTNHS